MLIEDSISYAVRSIARINGKNVLFAQHFVPIERWHDEKVIQAMMLQSFQAKTKIEADVEKMTQYQFLDLAEFEYPESWVLKSLPIRSIDRMRVELLKTSTLSNEYGKEQKRLDGQIDVALVSIYASDTLEDEVERFRELLAEKDLIMGDVIETRDDFLFGDKYDFVDTQVYRVSGKSERLLEHELWLTIMSRGDYYYFVSLFTPSRDNDYFLWARNTETYKVIVGTIKPMESAL